MKKTLALATLASVIAAPAFGQSYSQDFGTGNIIPPAFSMGAPGAYAQAPAVYGRGYDRPPRGYRFGASRSMDSDNASVPGGRLYRDETTVRSR
ncbi:MAG TPA: hypothetical protein VFP60_09675 [Pseudolabrys sp.]|nr:hypothetical protein [Pseudolabrys sp.]